MKNKFKSHFDNFFANPPEEVRKEQEAFKEKYMSPDYILLDVRDKETKIIEALLKEIITVSKLRGLKLKPTLIHHKQLKQLPPTVFEITYEGDK